MAKLSSGSVKNDHQTDGEANSVCALFKAKTCTHVHKMYWVSGAWSTSVGNPPTTRLVVMGIFQLVCLFPFTGAGCLCHPCCFAVALLACSALRIASAAACCFARALSAAVSANVAATDPWLLGSRPPSAKPTWSITMSPCRQCACLQRSFPSCDQMFLHFGHGWPSPFLPSRRK